MFCGNFLGGLPNGYNKGGSGSVTIEDNSLTLAKLVQIPTLTILGNPTDLTDDVQSIGLGNGLTFDGSDISIINAIPTGTTINNTLRWDGTNWLESDVLQILSNNVSIEGNSSSGALAVEQTSGANAGIIISNAGGSTSLTLMRQGAAPTSIHYQYPRPSASGQIVISATAQNTGNANYRVIVPQLPDASATFNFVLPNTQGTVGQVLSTDGFGVTSWITVSGSGNVSSSLDFTTDDRLILADFTSGAKNIKQSSILISDVSLNSDNLSNLASASTSRINLGVEIGADVQAWNTKLDVFSALGSGSNGQVLSTDGVGGFSWITVSGSGNVSSSLDFTTDDRLILADFTSGAKNIKQSSILISNVSLNSDNLSNLASASTSRINLGVEIGADVQAWNTKLDVFSALGSGSNGQVLSTDGVGGFSWITVSGSGNVSSSLDFTTDDRLILADFTSGAKNIKQSSILISDVSLNSDNLSNLASASTSRINLGVEIGADVQAYTATLDSIAGIPIVQGDIIIGTGINTAIRLPKGTTGQFLSCDATLPLWVDNPSGAITPQTATISIESAGSIDMGDGAWLELNVDEDGSLSIIDTSTILTGILYKLDMFNSDVAVVTITIPTGWISNTLGASIPLDPDEYSSALLWKDSLGNIHLSVGFSLEVV